MRFGNVYRFGTVILVSIQFVDTFEIKTRPALVLFEEYGNIVVAGITSNSQMEGILLTKKEGAVVDSIIKLNYIFTISEKMVQKKLFVLHSEKKKVVYQEFIKKLEV